MGYIKKMSDFFLASVAVHLALVFASGYLAGRPPQPAPVKVTIIPAEKPEQDMPRGKILDEIDQPQQSENPEEAEYLAARSLKVEKESGAKKGEKAINLKTPAEEKPEPEKEKQPAPEVAEVDRRPNKYATLPPPLPEKPREPEPEPKPKPLRETAPDTFRVEALDPEQVDTFIKKNPGQTMETGDEAIVSLNTRQFKYAEYFRKIREALEAVWYYPQEAVNKGVGGSTLLRFTITRDGALQEIAVIKSAGSGMLDKVSMDTVATAGPFSPFPEGLDKKRLHIVANFTYMPTFSAVNTRR